MPARPCPSGLPITEPPNERWGPWPPDQSGPTRPVAGFLPSTGHTANVPVAVEFLLTSGHCDPGGMVQGRCQVKGGPVGLNTIATAVSEEAGTLEEVYEPFLIKEGFLKRTPRGREVTELAYKHLGLMPESKDGELF